MRDLPVEHQGSAQWPPRTLRSRYRRTTNHRQDQRQRQRVGVSQAVSRPGLDAADASLGEDFYSVDFRVLDVCGEVDRQKQPKPLAQDPRLGFACCMFPVYFTCGGGS
ncbi:MAG: hypothetical protein ISS70_19180 [Phycisphaerae bacterium]|nr:hypothetical protein [Phycisphaerae bacterium]